jgi:16S rRNA (adenine1518-N6/adenine1519-N6)-dimethyltransferase
MSPNELIAFLHEIGAQPKKGLSQNFLIDANVIRKIVHLAAIQPGDFVLEIGPGAGAITRELLLTGAHVFAIEKDRLFAHHLPRLQTPDQRLEVICADFLDFPLQTLPRKNWKVVSNLPFQITTPVLERLCTHPLFQSFTLVMQKEIGERIQAKPKTKAFSSLTLFLQFYTTVHSSFHVPSSCFYPRPKVDASVLRFDPHPTPSIDPNRLFPLIRKAFQQRRKMLSTSLRALYPNMADLLASLHLSPKARPEELSLDQWIELYRKM